VFVALVIEHAKRMRRIILLSVPSPAVHYFSIISETAQFSGKVIENKTCVLIYSTSFI
jgi:DNA-directed RNA polymerase alpha subunit